MIGGAPRGRLFADRGERERERESEREGCERQGWLLGRVKSWKGEGGRERNRLLCFMKRKKN